MSLFIRLLKLLPFNSGVDLVRQLGKLWFYGATLLDIKIGTGCKCLDGNILTPISCKNDEGQFLVMLPQGL
ncbi:MAG: hypothetical protein NTZ39_05235 [Methanoregula sp.]|nr:hypothetical protein [Methanoregula sp.]